MIKPEMSHVVGPTEPGLLEITIGEALLSAAQRWPDTLAVISRHQDVRLTWRELACAADAVATSLLDRGVSRGDRVGIWAPNCVEWLILQFATARAGMILVNINPAYRTSELAYTLRKAGVKALVCASSFKTSDYVAMVEEVAPGLTAASGNTMTQDSPVGLELIVKIGGEPRPGWIDFEDLATGGAADLEAVAVTVRADDPVNIQFTSGTTGSPKGATLSHRNILNNGMFVGLGMELRPGDRLCVPVPLYHCFGMVMGNLAGVVHGATLVYPSPGFDALATLEAVHHERCTAIYGVPTMFIAELQHPLFSTFDLTSLRTGLMAGSPCPIEVMNAVMTRMGVRDIGVAYGMTETSPVSFQTSTTDTVERRVGTIGRIQPHLEGRVVDPDSGEVVPRGVAGELHTRGYSVMLGYWDEPQLTSESVVDGWMRTGDLVTIDEEGYGRVVGRAKDMIIRGGENVYPREIEEFLFSMDCIEEVQVVGAPDAKFGEEVCAFVRLKAGAQATSEEIMTFCRGRIAHYKVPRYVEFLEEFPMTVTGKVQKHVLREIIARKLEGVADRTVA